jgi:hypothetical protein
MMPKSKAMMRSVQFAAVVLPLVSADRIVTNFDFDVSHFVPPFKFLLPTASSCVDGASVSPGALTRGTGAEPSATP